VQDVCREWVTQAVAIHQKYNADGLNLDLPNFHLLIEIALRCLPVLRDMRIAMTNRFESIHRIHKESISQVSYCVGSAPENYAIRQYVANEAHSFVRRGGRWGPNLSHVGGPGALQVESRRDGFEVSLVLS
jgi:hypothetical protein